MKLKGKLGVRTRIRPDGRLGVRFVHYSWDGEEWFATHEHDFDPGEELVISPVYLIDDVTSGGGITIEWALAGNPPPAPAPEGA